LTPNRRRTLLGTQLVLAAAFAVLSALVVAGACTRIDQYAVDHWMAHVSSQAGSASVWSAFRPYPRGGSASETAFNIWAFPACVDISALGLMLCCVALVRRGQRSRASVWVAAWVAGNGIELAGKRLLDRPALMSTVNGLRRNIQDFDNSFPSGHTIRALLLAFMLAAVWPRLARPLLLWAVGVCIVLVLDGDHTPSDVAGGLVAALFVLACVAQRRSASDRFLRQE
jgi:membrane-associated phospholipid phosphatase